jgi:hypothetical protein
MSHGQLMRFGKRKYDIISTVLSDLIAHGIFSHRSPRMGALLASYCMLTRQDFQVLGQQRHTWLSHAVPTFLQALEMAMVLVVDVLLDGFQLFVH